MKSFLKILGAFRSISYLLVLAGMTLLTSCKDEIDCPVGEMDGTPVDINVSIAFTAERSVNINSRAITEQGVEYEGGDEGELIQNINTFWLVIYDKAGNLKVRYQVPVPGTDGQLPSVADPEIDFTADEFHIDESTISYSLSDNRLDPDEADLEDDAAGELKFRMRLPSDEYYIYGVANVDGFDKADISTRDKLKGLTFTWDKEYTARNSQMYGVFSINQPNREQTDASALQVTNKTNFLHAWLRRLASKVTVAFDGSALYDHVEVYIYDITIHDIPKQCTLGFENYPGWRDGKEPVQEQSAERYDVTDGLIRTGKTLKVQDDLTDAEKKDVRSDKYIHVCNSKHKYLGRDEVGNDSTQNDRLHSHAAKSLFFYENMQGKGKDKAQDCIEEGKISYPNPVENDLTSGWKDHKPYGSYIEVRGFYRNTSNTEYVSAGDIVYRFMLGQDVEKDYNAIRNTHYKLTLAFKGNGNDADWHIEYKEKAGLHVTSPQYISYLYNKEMNLTVKLSGDRSTLKDSYYLRAEIIGCDDDEIKYPHVSNSNDEFSKNDKLSEQTFWKPWGDGSDNYPNPMGQMDPVEPSIPLFYTGDGKTPDPLINNKPYYGPWCSFLSLKKTKVVQIPGPGSQNYSGMYDTLHSDFNDNDKGWRNFSIKPGTYTDETNGSYMVQSAKGESTSSNKVERVFSVPLFTRAKELVPASGFTGNNPYYAYPRKQRVKFYVASDEKGTKVDGIDPVYVDIIQVRRIVNPKGVWRSGDTKPEDFHVELTWLKSDDEFNTSTPFEVFNSIGPWSAEVVSGGDNIISLTSNTTGSAGLAVQSGVRRIEGASECPIDFTINFNGNKGCAIVRIRYHNYTCEHDIFCRVGYGPITIGRNNAQWETLNVYRFKGKGEAELCTSPLQEGSLFRRKSTTAILPSNNSWSNVWKAAGTLKVRELDSSTATDKVWKDFKADVSTPTWTIKNSDQRVATWNDFENLMETGNDATQNIKKAYGVLYGDGANSVAKTIGEAYGYDKTPDDKTIADTKGMRGVFVYDATTHHQIFFPIGKTGMGHRKASDSYKGETDGPGCLRYASRNKYYGEEGGKDAEAQPYLPLFQDLFRRTGAVYWTDQSDGDNTAFDINYHTMAFKSYGKDATNHGATGKDGYLSDACYLRTIYVTKK
ncbi:MAG: DUF4906 domain-containing protein [Muribaculaceae bacterium]|nr:DUF4906 domain-containing protein [Muribaculaceae bacterium]